MYNTVRHFSRRRNSGAELRGWSNGVVTVHFRKNPKMLISYSLKRVDESWDKNQNKLFTPHGKRSNQPRFTGWSTKVISHCQIINASY